MKKEKTEIRERGETPVDSLRTPQTTQYEEKKGERRGRRKGLQNGEGKTKQPDLVCSWRPP